MKIVWAESTVHGAIWTACVEWEHLKWLDTHTHSHTHTHTHTLTRCLPRMPLVPRPTPLTVTVRTVHGSVAAAGDVWVEGVNGLTPTACTPPSMVTHNIDCTHKWIGNTVQNFSSSSVRSHDKIARVRRAPPARDFSYRAVFSLPKLTNQRYSSPPCCW